MNIKETLQEYGKLRDELEEIQTQINLISVRKLELENLIYDIETDLKNDLIGSGMTRTTVYGWKINISESKSTVVEEPDVLPEEFWRIERNPDKTKIKEAIKIGYPVPGAILKISKNISIKRNRT